MALPWAGSLYQYPPGAGAEKRITPRKGPLPAADQKNELLRWVTKMRTNFTSEQIKAMICQTLSENLAVDPQSAPDDLYYKACVMVSTRLKLL